MRRRLNSVQRLGLILVAVAVGLTAAWLLGARRAAVCEQAPVPVSHPPSGETLAIPIPGQSPISAVTPSQTALQGHAQNMTASASDSNEIASGKAGPRQVPLSEPCAAGPGWMGTIRGLIICDPAGSYDFQDLLVEIASKRVKPDCEIDDQGRFAADNLPPGRYCVWAREVGAICQILCPGDALQIDANHPDHEVVLRVSRPAALTVLALEQGTRQPVSGLTIHVRSAKGPCQTSSTTDSEGLCEFELAGGQYLVETSVHVNGQPIQIGPEPLTVVGPGCAIQFALSIPARPPRSVNTLECLLTDSTGSPMPGHVTISGSYRADDTEPNTHFVIAIEPDRLPGQWSIGQACDVSGTLARRFVYREETSSFLEIVLECRATITGRVVDPGGQPIRRADLGIETLLPDGSRSDDSSFYGLSATDDGRFEFKDVSVGLPVKVVVDAEDRSPGQSRLLNLKAGQTVDVGDIVLAAQGPQNGVVSGRVTDENDVPIPRCQVWADDPGRTRSTALTTEAGRFIFEDLPTDEDVTMRIDLPGYGRWSRATRADDRSCNLQVFPEGWQVIGNEAPPLLVAQWWNSEPVSIEDVRGKIVVLALGADPFIDPPYQPPFLSYAEPLMDIHRRFGGTRVQIIIVLTSVSAYRPDTMDWVRRVLEDAYLEADDSSFAACVDGDPNLVARIQPAGCPSRGATYTLYQARRPNSLFVIDRQGVVRACPPAKLLYGWVQRLLAE